MDSNLIPETPKAITLVFPVDSGDYYSVMILKVNDGYTVNYYKNKNIIGSELIKWAIPPDYQAARELLLIHLNK